MAIVCLVGSLLLITSCGANQGYFQLVNETKESITQASIHISGQTIYLKNISSGQTVSGTYTIKTDSHYDINILFLSGKKLHKEIGYVTHGFDFRHKIVVTETDIKLIDSKVGY